MKTKTDKLQSALAYLQETHHAEWCTSYGEPGYSAPEKGIILANWNNVPKGLGDWLEKCGYSLEWSDEWTIDYNHSKAYRTSPDCHAWESQIAITDDGEMLTPDDDVSGWIDHAAMTDKAQLAGCLPSWVTAEDLENAGFTLYRGSLESGFHHGQTDKPGPIACEAFDNGASRVVFRNVENSQFYIVFECWVEMAECTAGAEE